jgi:predicted metal-dependent hydrolase
MLPLRQLFRSKRQAAPAPPLLPIEIVIAGETVVVQLKRHAMARRMVLRLARDGKSFVLTVPKRQGPTAALAFVEKSMLWMQNTRAYHGRSASPVESDKILLRGESLTIAPTGKLRGIVSFDPTSNSLAVPGEGAHRKRKIIDWLKLEAERDLRIASSAYAEKMQTSFSKLVVRDQKSRWGSCTSKGELSYSWRLVLAPPFVLDYVAAHEVAHLVEMNHGPRFWRLVLTNCAQTKRAKEWLKREGHTLHHVLSD